MYDLKNKGPATIQEAEVFILWPSFGDYKEHLLYLLGVDYDRSKVTCQPIKNINPDYVQVHTYIRESGFFLKNGYDNMIFLPAAAGQKKDLVVVLLKTIGYFKS